MNIFITRKIPEAGVKMLQGKDYEIDISEKDGVLTKEELISALRQKPYDAVLCLLTDKIDAGIFNAAPKAKIFANYAVGFDNIDLEAAKKRNVMITNTPDVLTEAVAEHTLALMLAISRRIVEADKFMRADKYDGWAPTLFLGDEIFGKTIGILGLGRIGAKLGAFLIKGFGARVLYYDIKRNEEFEKNFEIGAAEYKDNIDGVLEKSDFVSIHLPLLPQTRHIIDKNKLEKMKPTAYLINTSRGAILDEEALVDALKNKTIKGAALDVFENEPKLADGLIELDNIILTPHIASATEEARAKMSELAALNIIEALEGRTPPNLVRLS